MKKIIKKLTNKLKKKYWVWDGGGCSLSGTGKFPCDDTYIRKNDGFIEEAVILSNADWHLDIRPEKVENINSIVDGKNSIFISYCKKIEFKGKDKVINIDQYLNN